LREAEIERATMALRFRKTFSLIPGIKLNIGKRSASVRVGVKGFGFTTGTAGQTVSASVPGTGLSVSHRFKSDARAAAVAAPAMRSRRPWLLLLVVYTVAGLIWWAILLPK
jgi:hypothetical protein